MAALSVRWWTVYGSFCAIAQWLLRLLFLSILYSCMLGFVAVAQSIPDRHRFPSSAIAVGDSLSYSNAHGGSPGAGMRPTDDRSLASEDLPPSITLVEQELFARDVNGAAGTARVVLWHTPEAPLNATTPPFNGSSGLGHECYSLYRNIVFLPNSTRFFSILEQRCITQSSGTERPGGVFASNWGFTFRVMSVRQADLLPVRQGLQPLAEEAVLSYWWPADSTDGERVSSPIMYQRYKNMSSMAILDSMDIAKTGTHLVLASSRFNGSMDPTLPALSSLSTINGSRSLIMSLAGDVTSVNGIAFDRSKTKLFAIECCVIPWVRLLSADVDGSGYPVKSDGGDRVGDYFHIVHPLGSPPSPRTNSIGSDIFLSPHSVTSSGRCIYLLDTLIREMFGVDPSTSELTPVLGPDVEIKPSLSWSYRIHARIDIAATLDGCNLFITSPIDNPTSTGLVWVKMTRRCGKARSAELVARYDSRTTDIGSLALQELEGRLFLYVGTTDGRLFELEINQSQLHRENTWSRAADAVALALILPSGS